MAYTLAGDRVIEYNYVRRRLPRGEGAVLDFGPSRSAKMSLFAVGQGYRVTAVSLEQIQPQHPNLVFILGDVLTVKIGGKFDWVLNISTVEHCGLAGRYGVAVHDTDADLKAMEILKALLKPQGKMLLTIPVGLDTVVGHWHRVYGKRRLPRLLKGYKVLHQAFWAKSGDADTFQSVSKLTGLSTEPIKNPPRGNYYALGVFTLGL